MKSFTLSTLTILSTITSLVHSKSFDNGLGLTPQMGWNSWNKYGCDINETIIIETAKEIKNLGLLDYGYEYIVMDDCYALKTRDATTNKMIEDPSKFPNGIKNMSDQIHDLGFKFGMYSSAGKFTCGGYPGSLDYEEIDAQNFADWGIDYLKYDNCYNEGQSGNPKLSYDRYLKMSDALNSTGRSIFYSLCQWGEDNVWNWGPTLSNSWRISGDIYDNFDRYDDRCPCESYECTGVQGFKCSMTNILEKAIPLGQKAGPFNGWNDLDSLEVGNGGMTTDEYKSHFTLWSILKSPLVLGNDVTTMSDEDLSIIKNQDIIDINQDNSSPGYRTLKKSVDDGFLMLFTNKLENKDFIITLFNSGSQTQDFKVQFKDIFINNKEYMAITYNARELWTNETMTISNDYNVTISSHQTKIWKLVAQ